MPMHPSLHHCTDACRNAPNLFEERMATVGRYEEFHQRISAHLEAGMLKRQATYAAMREMGYRSLAEELKLHARAGANAMLVRHQAKANAWKREYQKRRRATKQSESPPE